MKPIKVSVTVDRPRAEVYEHLDVIAGHEAFCDHFLSDWSVSGPAGGVGAKVRVKAKAPGPETWIDIEVVDSVAPERTVLSLDQFGCLCSTMFRVSPNHLLWVLEGLADGVVHNRIVVPDAQKHWTKVALDRMLSIQ